MTRQSPETSVPSAYRTAFAESAKGQDHGGLVHEYEPCPICGAGVLVGKRQPKEGESAGFLLLEPGRTPPPCSTCQRIASAYPEVFRWVISVLAHHNLWCHDPRSSR